MQNKTEYCNSIVSKVLPMIYKVSDNYFIFSKNTVKNRMAIIKRKSFIIKYFTKIAE